MLYYFSTFIVCLFLCVSSFSYVFSLNAIEGFKSLGFPEFFRWQLAVLKLLAAIAIVIPFTPSIIREWAYAGTAFFLITAIVAHFAHKDPFLLNLVNIALFMMLVISRTNLPNLA